MLMVSVSGVPTLHRSLASICESATISLVESRVMPSSIQIGVVDIYFSPTSVVAPSGHPYNDC